MLKSIRARVLAVLDRTAFCDGCGQVCTPACQVAARREADFARIVAAGLPR